MILGILFVLAATLLSRTTTPPHHDTWEAIETKANSK